MKFKAGSAAKTSFITRLEKADGNFNKIINENIAVSSNVKAYRFTSDAVQENGNYQLALYFGNLKQGDKVWIDDVELIPVKK